MSSPSRPVTNARRNSDEPATIREGRLKFGDFVVDWREGVLYRQGQVVALAPKPFDTLAYLAAHPRRVVPKQELLDAIWPDTFVTDDVLVQGIVEVRRALGDSAREPRWIQTLPKRGYRFLGEVTVETPAAGPPADLELVPGPPPGPPAGADAAPGPAIPPPRPQTGAWPVLAGDAVPAEGETGAVPARPWWQRPSRVAAVALGLVLVLAATWVGSSTWLRQGARLDGKPDALAGYGAEPGTVAILPVQMVELSGDTAWLRDGLAEIIALEITNDPAIRVVPRQRLAAALRSQGVLDASFVPLEAGLLAARDLKVERLVTGSFQRVGQQFTLAAQVVDVGTGEQVRDVVVRGERRADLLDAVASLCRQLAAQLSAPERAGTAAPVASPPTSSEGALRAYTEALAAEALGGRENLALAEQRLAEATRLDPGFARAYLRMAVVQQARRRWGYGTSDPAPAVRAARRLEAQLPERERLFVRGMASLYVDGQPGKAIEQWKTLLQLYPTYGEEAGVAALVVDTQMQIGAIDDLTLVAEAHVESPALGDHDRALVLGLLAKAFQRRGEFDRAAALAARAVDNWPVRDGPAYLRVRTALGRVLTDAGQRDRAADIFRSVAADVRADVVNVTDAAWGLYMVGLRPEALATVARALRMDESYGNAYHLRGWLRLTSGDDEGAAADLRLAFERTPHGFGLPETGVIRGDLAALYYAGVAQQRAGRADQAAAAWRELVARSREALRGGVANPVVRWQAEYLVALGLGRLGEPVTLPGHLDQDEAQSLLAEARVLAVLGRRAEALETLRRAITLGAGDFQHIRDDPNFDELRARPEFVRLLQTFGGRPSS